MKPACISFSRLVALTTAVAFMAFALGVGCSSVQDAATPNNGENEDTSHAETAHSHQHGDPGVSDDHILFGQSAAFTGPAKELGEAMRLGIQAAFDEVNQNGGVHGRRLILETLNDAYENRIRRLQHQAP